MAIDQLSFGMYRGSWIGSKADRGKPAKPLAPYGQFGANWLGRVSIKNDFSPIFTRLPGHITDFLFRCAIRVEPLFMESIRNDPSKRIELVVQPESYSIEIL